MLVIESGALYLLVQLIDLTLFALDSLLQATVGTILVIYGRPSTRHFTAMDMVISSSCYTSSPRYDEELITACSHSTQYPILHSLFCDAGLHVIQSQRSCASGN